MPNYTPQPITAALLKRAAKWANPDRPREIRDAKTGMILRHQPTGRLTLYVEIGRGKRERLADVQEIIDPEHEITFEAVRRSAKVARGEDASGRNFKAERAAVRAIPTLSEYMNDAEEGTYGYWLTHNRKSGATSLDRLRYCFEESYGARKLHEITRADIEGWRTKRTRKGLSPKTINRDVAQLHAGMEKAVEWRILTENPLRGLKPLKVDKHEKPLRAFTPEELESLRAYLAQRDEKTRQARDRANQWRLARHKEPLPEITGYADALTPTVEISIETGLRQGELFALEWDMVDLKGAAIHVPGRITKAHSTRTIPLNSAAAAVLRAWNMQNGRPTKGLIFAGESGAYKSLRKALYAAITAAGIERVTQQGRLAWHSLRHTFGTRLGAAGCDVQTLKELMGHADIATTQQYLHTTEDRKREAVARLEAIG
ncbi:MAG: tyrosine-type recombinase/integrase [FCB group bacterium]|nr:tyrosine-type recombinase/integrase [FCB group bacterium]